MWVCLMFFLLSQVSLPQKIGVSTYLSMTFSLGFHFEPFMLPMLTQVKWITFVASSWHVSVTWKISPLPWMPWTWIWTRCVHVWMPPIPLSQVDNGLKRPWRRKFRPCDWILEICRKLWRIMILGWKMCPTPCNKCKRRRITQPKTWSTWKMCLGCEIGFPCSAGNDDFRVIERYSKRLQEWWKGVKGGCE